MAEKGPRKLTKRQRAELERQDHLVLNSRPLRTGLSRRRFLTIGAAFGGALLASVTGYATYPNIVASFEPNPRVKEIEALRKAEGRRYDGPSPRLTGESYVRSVDLVKMLEALESTNYPLLKKVSSDLTALFSNQRHPELSPDLVSAASIPLPVVETKGNFATVGQQIDEDLESGQKYHFIVPSESMHVVIQPIKPISYDIVLSKEPFVKQSSVLCQSIFLAKEVLSLQLILGYSRDYERLMTRGGYGYFLDGNMQPLVNDTDKRKAGVGLLASQTASEKSSTWISLDSSGVLMLAPLVYDLTVKNRLTKKDLEILGVFADAYNIIKSDPTLPSIVQKYNNGWASNNGLIPTNELVAETASGPLFRASTQLHRKNYPQLYR